MKSKNLVIQKQHAIIQNKNLNYKEMTKLTYYQICSLAAQGRFSEIPSEYNIVWLGPEPHKCLEAKVNGENLTIIGNKFANQTKLN